MTFPSYAVYKESGVEWQGVVPAEWPRSALKYLADYQNGYPFKPEDWGEEGLPIIRISQLTGDTAPNYYSGELDCRVKVNDGDLLFSWSATIDSFIWAGGAAWLNQHIFKVSPTFEADKKFLFYLIKLVAPKLADFDAHGSTMRHIKKESLSERLHIPTLVEQTQVARFLDHETARIDALIEEQQRLIELLKEKRQALISHVVTKGLDPTVPMKDFGVEWLGEVPAHWEVTQVKRRCDLITDGAHISPETENGVYCFVSTKDVSDAGIDFEGALRTSAASYEYLVRTGCRPEVGDVLFSKDGTIGRTIVVGEGSPDFVVASSLIIIRPCKAELFSEYLDFLCQSWVVSQQVDGFVKGAGLPRLSIQNLTKVIGVFPPVEEQKLIVDFLQLQCIAVRRLANEALRTMELLKERRSALISAAVTGKIDVRGWQPPAGTPSPESAIAEAH